MDVVMDVVHHDYLFVALHRVLSVVVLLVCLLAEVLVFSGEHHAALYLVPVCCMLLLHRLLDDVLIGSSNVYMVDFSCLKPPRRLRAPIPSFVEHLKLMGCFEDDGIEFMAKAVAASGMGDETYLPAPLHLIPPDATHGSAVREARALLFPTLDELFTKAGVPPSAVGALVVSCSGFCPAPSLAAEVASHYRMRGDVRAFNLSGMGCSAGVAGVDVARGVLATHAAVEYAVAVSAEVLTVGWYAGRDHGKLLLNCTFRTGCSAALLTSSRRRRRRAKYRLVRLVRTNLMANDEAYHAGYREEDDEGVTGFNVPRGVGAAFELVLRAHLAALGASVLPWPEKLRYVAALLRSRLLGHRCPPPAVPSFRAAAEHFCLPTTWAAMIRRLGQGIGLGDKDMEAALMTYHRFGNQSAASLLYQLAYLEAKGVVRMGDRVWHLGVGSGLKVNSAVWERVAADADEDDRAGAQGHLGPWIDCIDRYPISE